MKKIWNNTLDEGLIHLQLENGINLYYYPKKGFTKKYAIFSTSFGSNHTSFIDNSNGKIIKLPNGTAHFLEHKLFEDPDRNIFERFAKYGADVNAYTNFDQTSYLFSTSDNFYDSLSLLVEFVQNPYLTDENIEKEKGIIGQEIQMYRDNPRWRVYFNCLSAMYHNHPVKDDIAGTIDSISEIFKEDLLLAYNRFYHPSNMVLFVVGDLELDRIAEAVNKASRGFPADTVIPVKYYPEEPSIVRKNFIEDYMSTSKPLFYIGYKDTDPGKSGKASVKKDIVTNMLLDVLLSESSEFYQDVYSQGLIDSSFGAYYSGKSDYGQSMIVGQSDDPKRVYQLVIELMSNKMSLLSEDAFLRVKKKEMGRFLMGLNSVEFIANNLTDLYFQGFYLMDYLDLLSETTFEDLLERFEKHFSSGESVLSVIWPEGMVK